MTPQEKAKELINKYSALHYEQKRGSIIIDLEKSARCALIAVDEILEIFNDTNGSDYRLEYWKEVKQEILSL